jgi:hypothetical protein
MNARWLLLTKFWSIVKTIPSLGVSSIFTSKLQLAPISLLNTIASNIFISPFSYPNLPSRYAKNIWTGGTQNWDTKYMGLSTLKASCYKNQKTLFRKLKPELSQNQKRNWD